MPHPTTDTEMCGRELQVYVTAPNTGPYHIGQRVKVLPGIGHPPTAYKGGVRYGTITQAKCKAGTKLKSEGRQSIKGEWCYNIRFQSDAKPDYWWSDKHITRAHVKGDIENPPRNNVKEWRCAVTLMDDSCQVIPIRARSRCRAVYHLGKAVSNRKYEVKSVTIEE